jgi:hypothetical protein
VVIRSYADRTLRLIDNLFAAPECHWTDLLLTVRVVCQIRSMRFLLANSAFANSCKRCENSSHSAHDTLMHSDSSRGIKNYSMHCHASPCVPRSNLNTCFLRRRRQSANLHLRFRPRVVHGSRCCVCLIVSSRIS